MLQHSSAQFETLPGNDSVAPRGQVEDQSVRLAEAVARLAGAARYPYLTSDRVRVSRSDLLLVLAELEAGGR